MILFRRLKFPAVVFGFALSAVFLLSTVASSAETIWLDELDLSKAAVGWGKPGKNISADGNPLTIQGVVYQRGFGGHSQGCLTIKLDGKAQRFTSLVGIDDEKGDKAGQAQFRVVGDGKDLWKSGDMTGAEGPKRVDVSLEGVKKLDLMMDLGTDGTYGCDHMDWVDAKITYAGAKPVTTGASRGPATSIGGGGSSHFITPNTLPTDRPINQEQELEWQWKILENQIAQGFRPHVIEQALHQAANVYKGTDRDPLDVVIRRVEALLEHFTDQNNWPKLEAERKQFADIVARAEKIEPAAKDQRRELFNQLCTLRREISFQNPLCNFDRLLFIKRHFNPNAEKTGNHMCDQFFGFHARLGGGLFVLEKPFGDAPKATDLLADAPIGNGRLQGVKLDSSWGFLSPELSFDGRKILFSASDAKQPRHTYTWNEDNTYHMFQVDVDGKNLTQMTDGPWNDFDPCFLPSGRIAFISERRGGYGRCHGRPVPSFTLHSMNHDATDIITMSPHETNEWAPSVDNNGMIIYTRWDYVDRGFNQAHHPWITTPDGRDSRAIQGNFAERASDRPHFEVSVRAIDGSHKFTATAACHHGQVYGALVLVDPKIEDDDKMAPVRRITPDQLFPESECPTHRGPANYATAWPLSEDFYVCVYDPDSKSNEGEANNYGIYLLDKFGNRELLYRDPLISCMDPIPLRPRRQPPVIPHAMAVGKPLAPGEKFVATDPEKIPTKAPVMLMNVYDSRLPLPEGTEVKALRIVQLLPKTTTHAHNPAIGYGNQKSARAVLGTVPVEKDGSANFMMPVDIPVYFQAIDQDGYAVYSMRSATYVHPGERLVCQGCHERRYDAPTRPTQLPLAMRRPASEIKPDVDGSKPFSFPRLVQPVFDKHCVECHRKSSDPKAMDLSAGNIATNGGQHYPSYKNLRNWAFFWDNASWTTPRTIPGQFGAQASKLDRLLIEGHHDVNLSADELHRIRLWLDCNSDFFGSYENTAAQSKGEIVHPTLE